jgi:hypothetical protein
LATGLRARQRLRAQRRGDDCGTLRPLAIIACTRRSMSGDEPPMPIAQRNLFDNPDAAALVRSESVARALTRNQRRFNQLAERLQKLRAELATWQRAVDRYQQRAAAEIEPLQRQLLGEQRAAVLALDQLLGNNAKGERLSRARRTKLAELVVTVAGAVLQSGADREIEAVFDRYSDLSYDEMQRAEVDLAEAVFGHVFGEDVVAGHGASSVEELIDHAGEQLHSKLEVEAEKRRERAQARRSSAGAAASEREASQSVRDVFRRLAGALHPDREPDAGERARKTALMQRVNRAYESNDLLELLSVQSEIEQIDASHLAQASEEQLGHYCAVLREQERALQEELNAIRMPFCSALGIGPHGSIQPAALDLLIDRDARGLREALQQLRDDMEAFRDPRRRSAAIDAIELDDDEPDAIEAMLAATLAPPPKRRKKRSQANGSQTSRKSNLGKSRWRV